MQYRVHRREFPSCVYALVCTDPALSREDPLYIDDKNRVVLSVQQYEGLLETLRILSNPADAQDLREAIAEADAGLYMEHELIEE